jgi:hypothetical protein
MQSALREASAKRADDSLQYRSRSKPLGRSKRWVDSSTLRMRSTRKLRSSSPERATRY